MEEYGETLALFHQKKIRGNPMKDRRFFHKPSKELLESLELENLENCLSKNINKESRCFCHGDFHYANILWKDHHISGILDFELTGFGSKEFDIAWALFRRPGQKFLLTKEEQQEFLNGYRKYGDFCEETVETYIAWCYVYFLDICKDDDEYCDYVRDWLGNLV